MARLAAHLKKPQEKGEIKNMNNLVYIGSLSPGEEFFYKGKHYRFYGRMIRNYRECAACYEAGTSGNRILKFLDPWEIVKQVK